MQATSHQVGQLEINTDQDHALFLKWAQLFFHSYQSNLSPLDLAEKDTAAATCGIPDSQQPLKATALSH